MKLYSADLSPYSARARISIYAKKLPVEIVAPPAAGIKSDEYLKLNPMGRLPVLVLDDGMAIPESETIVEYIEDAFPDPSLRPSGPEARAKVRLIARVAELYVMQPMSQLFGHMNPATRDAAAVEIQAGKLEEGLSYLETFLAEGPYAAGEKFTTADCEVTPVLFFVGVMSQTFGWPDLLTRHARTSAYLDHARTDPVLAKVLEEMANGLKNSSR